MKTLIVDRFKIEKQFEKETGISTDLICEFRDVFPISRTCRILLLEREFEFMLTEDGKRIKKESIKEL